MLASAAGRRGARPRRGFSIVETLVALTVLVSGLLALASVSSLVARRVGSAQRLARATSAASSLVDSLAGLPCEHVASGRDAVGAVEREWTVTQQGRALAVSVETRSVAAAGRVRIERVSTALPCEAP